MLKRQLIQADFVLLAVVLLLTAFGVLNIYSCTHAQLTDAGSDPGARVKLQLLYVVLGLLCMIAVMAVDYTKLQALAPIFYGICLLLLCVVLVMGQVRGASRWIPIGPLHLQPGELAQLGVILLLGAFMVGWDEIADRDNFMVVVRSLLLIAVPCALLMLQPDLGTPVLIGMIWLFMMFIYGARTLHLAAIVFTVLVMFVAVWNTPIVREHQKARLLSFVNPEEDPSGAGYQVRQSKTAIGSGHIFGQGPLKGPLSKLSFIPDQYTDFIFTVVGEEYGFLGSIIVIGAYGVVLWRALSISLTAKDIGGRLIAAGVLAMFFVHVAVNLSMTMGMAPVKGMPLPFMSYGGSNMIASFMGVGLLENVFIRRHKINF